MRNCYWCGAVDECRHYGHCEFCKSPYTIQVAPVGYDDDVMLTLCEHCAAEYSAFWEEQRAEYYRNLL